MRSSSTRLGFAGEASRAFSFLETEYGFSRIVTSSELVRYQRGPFFVNVICEVGINALLGREARLRDGPFAIWKRLVGAWGIEFPVEYLAEVVGAESELDPERLSVARLAQFVRDHAHGVLVGEPGIYRELARLGRRRRRELTDWASGKHSRRR